jgi:hypothetical protein
MQWGTRLKILNVGNGKAVVSASIGCEGLAAVDGDNIVIRNHARMQATLPTPCSRYSATRSCVVSWRWRRRATAERLHIWEPLAGPCSDIYMAIARGQLQISATADSAVVRQEHA